MVGEWRSGRRKHRSAARVFIGIYRGVVAMVKKSGGEAVVWLFFLYMVSSWVDGCVENDLAGRYV